MKVATEGNEFYVLPVICPECGSKFGFTFHSGDNPTFGVSAALTKRLRRDDQPVFCPNCGFSQEGIKYEPAVHSSFK